LTHELQKSSVDVKAKSQFDMFVQYSNVLGNEGLAFLLYFRE